MLVTGIFGVVCRSHDQDAISLCTAFSDLFDFRFTRPLSPAPISFIDSMPTLLQLQDFAVANDWRVPVLIKIDAGNKRAGVPDSDALEIAQAVAGLERRDGGSVQFLGIYSHSGHAYACTCLAESRACAAEECRRMGELCARLEASGVRVPVVSVGSVELALNPQLRIKPSESPAPTSPILIICI